MLQIKTIGTKSTLGFDTAVNEALAEGWQLTRRYYTDDGYFIAELEREIITEEEKCCENCAHYATSAGQEPCLSCSEDCDKWEPLT